MVSFRWPISPSCEISPVMSPWILPTTTISGIINITMSWYFSSKKILAVVQIINVLPTKVLNCSSPHVVQFNKIPNYSFYKVFDCVYFPLLRPYNKNKFDFHSSMCLFLGYSPQSKGYICLSPNSKVYIS